MGYETPGRTNRGMKKEKARSGNAFSDPKIYSTIVKLALIEKEPYLASGVVIGCGRTEHVGH
jgi:hypothetical protein